MPSGRRISTSGLALLAALALGCGEPAADQGLPVLLEPGGAIGYELAWEKVTTHGEGEQGRLAWTAHLTVHVDEVDGGTSACRIVQRANEAGQADTEGTFRIDRGGVVTGVAGFARPSGYHVTSGGVDADDLLDAPTWLQTHLRLHPPGPLARGAVWTFPAVFEGLPLSVRVRFHAAVSEIRQDEVVILATGVVEDPVVDAPGRLAADWVRAAEKEANARVVVSRKDGLVRELEFRLMMQNDTRWVLGATTPAEPDGEVHRTTNVTRLVRRDAP
jgi:hypothetical protein